MGGRHFVQKSAELQALWEEYKRTSNVELRNQLVEAYLPLVDYLAGRIAERLPRCVGLDEVRSAGVVGLLDAVQGFDLSRGIKFETYCSLRVRGSILDELRSRDWAPRLVRNRAQKYAAALHDLQAKLGRKPTPPEIMKELELTPSEFEKLQHDVARLAIFSLSQSDDGNEPDGPSRSQFLVDSRNADPSAELEKQEATDFVLAELEQRERAVLELYYFQGLTMKEIGRRLQLSESRVCQIHGHALTRVRDELQRRGADLAL
jgi:RNA polymerase sigma factor for flagellar operon FliA